MSCRVERSFRFGLTSLGLCISTTVWAVDENNELEGEPPAAHGPTPVGLLQVWGTVWDQDEEPSTDPASYGDPEDDIGFKIRRARVGLQGNSDQFRYEVVVGTAAPFDQVAGGDSDVELIDGYGATLLFERLWVSLGMQRVPVSREMLINAGNLSLGERSVASQWMAPGRDLGLVLDTTMGEDIQWRVQGGLFNGNNDLLGDVDPGMLASLRVDASLGPADLSAPHGMAEGFSIGVGMDGYYDQSFSTQRLGIGVDMAARFGPFTTIIEGRFQRISPVDGADLAVPEVWSQTDRLGGFAQAGYSLGAWEPVVRFSTFDDSRSTNDYGDVSNVMGGAVWHHSGNQVQLGAGYVKRLERNASALGNDTARFWLQTQL